MTTTYPATITGSVDQTNFWQATSTFAVGNSLGTIFTGVVYIPLQPQDTFLTKLQISLHEVAGVGTDKPTVSVVYRNAIPPPSTTQSTQIIKNYVTSPILTLPLPGPGGSETVTLPTITTQLQAAWRSRSQAQASPHALILVFTLPASTTSEYTFNQVSVTATELTTRTGLVGIQYVRDREWGITSGLWEDPKTGQDVAADETVLDGWLSVRVAAENWDPRQRRRPQKRAFTSRVIWRP